MGVFDFVGDIVGGFLGARSAENAKDANVAMSAADRDFQREMATQGIRYRVADARAAGISPLAAMGAQLISPSPTAIGVQPDNSWANAASSMGQNIDRALSATSTKNERLLDLQIRRGELENDLLDSQVRGSRLAVVRQAGNSPPFPSSADTSRVVVDPSRRTSTAVGEPSFEAAVSPANKVFRNLDGSYSIWPSKDAKESIEDSLYEYEHMYRNRLRPAFSEIWNSLTNSQSSRRLRPQDRFR